MKTSREFYSEWLDSRLLISQMAEKYDMTWMEMANILTKGREEAESATQEAV